MESQTQSHTERQIQAQQHRKKRGSPMKKSLSRGSESSCLDSPHSPLRFHSPLRSDAGDFAETPPYESPENSFGNSRAIVAVEKQKNAPAKPPPAPMIVNRAVREDAPPSVAKVGHGVGEFGDGTDGRRTTTAVVRKAEALNGAALGFRISEVVLCLISFSVMAADRTQGWSGDSFDRYKEYRYCLCVNVIAFVYSLFQTYTLAYYLATGKHVIKHHLRRHFELFMDQVLAYLLISAASSAATRVDDWQSNWGQDEFTKMATASVVMAFLAFAAFSVSSLISGFNLWTESSV